MTESPAPDELVPDLPEVFLHIGTMKTGTSYLQQVLQRNADALAESGVLYANTIRGSGSAIHETLGEDRAEQVREGAWVLLADAMLAWDGHAVVLSSELLSFVAASTAAAIVESFQPARVTIVVTARDLVKLLPSAWQNKVKHGKSWPFASYVESVMAKGDEPGGPARSFWHHHDLATIVGRWVAAAGADRVVVVPVPSGDSSPDALWKRFAEVTGIDPHAYDASQDRRSNLSMGYAETELLRRVNRELRDRFDEETYRRVVLKYLANEVLRPDPSEAADRSVMTLDPAAHAWAVQRSQELVDEVVALGVQIAGSPDELVPKPLEPEREDGARTDPPAVAAGLVRTVTALLLRIDELEREIRGEPADSGEAGRRRRGRRNRGPVGGSEERRRRQRRNRPGETDDPASQTSRSAPEGPPEPSASPEVEP